jgi:hypothetical protein
MGKAQDRLETGTRGRRPRAISRKPHLSPVKSPHAQESKNNQLTQHPLQLTEPLPLLAKIINATTYSAWNNLIAPNDISALYLDSPPALIRNIQLSTENMASIPDSADTHLSDCPPAHLPKLCGALDGPHDTFTSDPARIWYQTHLYRPLHASITSWRDQPMWQCGYVLWDIPNFTEWENLWDIAEGIREQEDLFHRYHKQWHEEDGWREEEIKLLEMQKEDIFEAGGRGYWPTDGVDFSRIEGLSEEDQRRLVEKWEAEEGNEQSDGDGGDESGEDQDELEETGDGEGGV